MKLADVKRLAVRRGVEVRFRLRGGRECLIDAHGLARVPGLDGPPDFNLEDEFAQAEHFVLEAAAAGPGRKSGGGGPQMLTRRQLEELLAPGPAEHAGKPAEE
jgi:hypothetical protein